MSHGGGWRCCVYSVIRWLYPLKRYAHPFLSHKHNQPPPTHTQQREIGAVLEEYSLALEVGPSQVVQGERGLFIRVMGEDVEVGGF